MPDLAEYRAALSKIDAAVAAVSERRRADLACRKGCSACCVAGLSVLPVEAESILRFLDDNPAPNPHPAPGMCAFLDAGGACTIYSARPVVCRTHGMALRAQGEVSHCELNFTEDPPAAEDILDATQLQMLLTVVDARFRAGAGLGEGEAERVPLAALAVLE